MGDPALPEARSPHFYWAATKTQGRTVRPFLLSFPLPLNISSQVEQDVPGLRPQILCPPQAARLAISATNMSLPLLSTDCHSLFGSAIPFHRWGSSLRGAGTWPRSRAGSGRLGLPVQYSLRSTALHPLAGVILVYFLENAVKASALDLQLLDYMSVL